MTLYSKYGEGFAILEEQSISTGRYGDYSQESVRTTEEIWEDYNLRREQGEVPGMLPESPIISAEEAQRRISRHNLPGLSIPEEGIRSRALDILIESHNRSRKLAVINEMAPDGVVSSAYGLFRQVIGTAFDPTELSITLAMMAASRGVGAALRSASLLARFGSRFAYGFSEAAAGQAFLEPLFYDIARRRQEEYNISQSVLNVVAGGILGGALHGIGGLTGDITRRASGWTPQAPLPRLLEPIDTPERLRILGLGVGQAGLGRPIDVESAASRSMSRADAPVDFTVTRPLRTVGPDDVLQPRDRVIVSFRGGQELREGTVTRIADDGDPLISFRQPTRGAVTPEELAQSSREGVEDAMQAAQATAARQQQVKIPREKIGLYEPNRNLLAGGQQQIVRATPAEAREFKDALRAIERGRDITPEMRANLIQRGFLTEGGEITDLGRAFNRVAMPRISDEATPAAVATRLARSTEEPSEVADVAASKYADEIKKKWDALDENVDELVNSDVEGARQVARALGDESIVNRELADADELIKTAGEYGNMVKAYANCIIRRGA